MVMCENVPVMGGLGGVGGSKGGKQRGMGKDALLSMGDDLVSALRSMMSIVR